MSTNTWDNPFFLTVAGSQLYGTSTPESDWDLRGVCHQTRESLIGMQPFEQFQSGTEDTTIYGINKFCTLAMGCNPNIIELMFAPVDNQNIVRVARKEWRQLMEIRSAFLSRKARHTFTGYAYSQLERINRHHKWLVNPAPVKPIPEDYSAYHSPEGNVKWRDNEQYNRYLNVKREYDQYTEWVKGRNPARAELEKKYGYDTKNGLHLCRLMLMGQELLATGHITLPCPDAKWLLEVRNGKFDYDGIVSYAANMEENMKRNEEFSPLPWGPDFNTIHAVVMEINLKHLSEV